jgi:ZIP family zinc transporter
MQDSFMVDLLKNLHPVLQAFIATCFTWAMTASGAAVVFLAKDLSRKFLDAMLALAAGIMLSASFWSLLTPAIEMSKAGSLPCWLPATIGFIIGGLLLSGVDKILPHLHVNFPMNEAEGIKTTWRRSTLLILAITLHNVPEGLAVGVAFGAAAAGRPTAAVSAAVALAIGIGIQNLPEGLAVAMPLRREGMSRARSFWYGQLSGIVEPIAGVLGAWVVFIAEPILPYALGFAAGAMVFVVIEEVIPESQRGGNTDLATWSTMLGFVAMMILDISFS